MGQRRSGSGSIVTAIVVIAIVVIAAWWYFSRTPGLDFAHRGPAPASAPAAASTAPPPITHPISAAETAPAPATTTPLPILSASGNPAASALAALPGAKGLADLLIARALIPHIVAVVNALPTHGVSVGNNILPLRTPRGAFQVDKSADGQLSIDPANHARYAPYMQIAKAINARALVTWYVRWYPLFQQAYRQLGYPHGYFNDRLMQAIDNLLAAPDARAPVAVVAIPGGHYAFADPTWESLSIGQKLMIRVGANNERVLKLKLNRIRALLLGKAPVLHTATPAPATTAAGAG